ncbi:hypothetical protein BBJ28_00002544 [Nothophytophthora sp. Chile5]|nr:hypothetical protein BBJ28_00002544 [Nothophytophthora sp. Chile5]
MEPGGDGDAFASEELQQQMETDGDDDGIAIDKTLVEPVCNPSPVVISAEKHDNGSGTECSPTLGAIMQRVHLNDGDVQELDFSALAQRNKRLESAGCALVARSLMTNHTVRKLIIRDHAIGDDGAIALARMLCNNTTLECLDLYGNGIGDRGIEALAQALYGHGSLTHLFLWSNLITDRGVEALAQAVRCNCTLKYLGLVHNRISQVGAQALLGALDVNFNLESVNLDANDVPRSITNQLGDALVRNRAEAPMVRSRMQEEEAEITRRLAEMSGYGQDDDDEADEEWEDEDGSESSGFLTCSGVTDVPLSDSGLWI